MKVSVLIPCYNVEEQIEHVLTDVATKVDTVIVVNDCSTDDTALVLASLECCIPNLVVLNHEKNKGVGGAMKTAFRYALQTDSDCFVKLDGDGQMDTAFLPKLLAPILEKTADFTKGNRFHNFQALRKMPIARRLGNLGLSFLIKAASGYWKIFDPSNGFIAIHKKVLEQIELNHIADDYFFESSLLIELKYTKARIQDVPMPAIYNDESSNLSIRRTLLNFPPRLFFAFVRRILLQYFLFDFNIASLFILMGVPMFLFGVIFGVVNWIYYATQNITAPLGTIMLATLTVVIGFQLLLAAIQYDITNQD